MAGADAAGADLDGLDAAVFHGANLLQIGVPDGTGFIVGVAHVVAKAGAFSAYIAFSGHYFFLRVIAEKKLIADRTSGCKRKFILA